MVFKLKDLAGYLTSIYINAENANLKMQIFAMVRFHESKQILANFPSYSNHQCCLPHNIGIRLSLFRCLKGLQLEGEWAELAQEISLLNVNVLS